MEIAVAGRVQRRQHHPGLVEGIGLERVPGEVFPLRNDPAETRTVANNFNCNVEGRISHEFVLCDAAFFMIRKARGHRAG